jgi:hypothetical protein
MKKKPKVSENLEAEKIFGRRIKGTPFQLPFELDYACPLCTTGIHEGISVFDKQGNIKEAFQRLEFSEYNYFMWCSKCNLDIPSFLCLTPKSREAIEIYTERFIEFGKELKQEVMKTILVKP